ncbi:Rim9 protein [Pseudohyphozyma bogoriensis]|nr:Rim9 protein [Pseudohyphozyma bogoriensis]
MSWFITAPELVAELTTYASELPASENPYVFLTGILDVWLGYSTPPPYYKRQLLGISVLVGLMFVGLAVAIGTRAWNEQKKGFWIFRIIDGHERYLVPHGVNAWSTVLAVECLAVESYIIYYLRWFDGPIMPGLTFLVTLIWAMAWLVAWLASWSITISHLLQLQSIEGRAQSSLTSARVVNAAALGTLALFICTVIPTTAVTYVGSQWGYNSFHLALARLEALGATWTAGDAVDLSSLGTPFEHMLGWYQMAIRGFSGLLMTYFLWSVMFAVALAFIGILRLRSIKRQLRINHSGMVATAPATLSTLSWQLNSSLKYHDEISVMKAWWSLLSVVLLLCGSTLGYASVALWGYVSGETYNCGYILVLVIFYTTIIFGIPVTIVILRISFRYNPVYSASRLPKSPFSNRNSDGESQGSRWKAAAFDERLKGVMVTQVKRIEVELRHENHLEHEQMEMRAVKKQADSTVVVLVATVLLVLVTISVPLTKTFYFLDASLSADVSSTTVSVDNIKLGVFGFCVGSSCSNATVGYSLSDVDDLFGISGLAESSGIPSTLIKWLTYVLILHPIAAGFGALATLCGLLAHIREFQVTFFTTCFASFGATIALVAFGFDLALFIIAKKRIESSSVNGTASLGNAIWMTLVAFILLATSGCFFGQLGRCLVRNRNPRREASEKPSVDPEYGASMRQDALGYRNNSYIPPPTGGNNNSGGWGGFGRNRNANQSESLPAFVDKDGEVIPLTAVEHDEVHEPYYDHRGGGSDIGAPSLVSGVGEGYGRRQDGGQPVSFADTASEPTTAGRAGVGAAAVGAGAGLAAKAREDRGYGSTIQPFESMNSPPPQSQYAGGYQTSATPVPGYRSHTTSPPPTSPSRAGPPGGIVAMGRLGYPVEKQSTMPDHEAYGGVSSPGPSGGLPAFDGAQQPYYANNSSSSADNYLAAPSQQFYAQNPSELSRNPTGASYDSASHYSQSHYAPSNRAPTYHTTQPTSNQGHERQDTIPYNAPQGHDYGYADHQQPLHNPYDEPRGY